MPSLPPRLSHSLARCRYYSSRVHLARSDAGAHVAKIGSEWTPPTAKHERSEADGTWRIKVSTVGKLPNTVEVATATEIVVRLPDAGAIGVARRFRAEVGRTRRYMDGRLGVRF
jgi:hypothetical protein